MGREISSLITKHWKDHWPSVLFGIGLVIGGIVAIVNAYYFHGTIFIIVGIATCVLSEWVEEHYGKGSGPSGSMGSKG